MNKILRVKLLKLIFLSFVVFIFVSCQPPDSSRITFGEKSLAFYKLSLDETVLPDEKWKTDPKREQAVNSIAEGQYKVANDILTDYLNSEPQPNDPEAQIFLNNIKDKVEKDKKVEYYTRISHKICDR